MAAIRPTFTLYEWIVLGGVISFCVFVFVLLLYALRARSITPIFALLILFGCWVIVGNLAHFYVFEHNPVHNRLLPLAVHLIKDASGLCAVVAFLFWCAEKLEGIAPSRSVWAPRVLELSCIAGVISFLVAVVFATWTTVNDPVPPTNLETSPVAKAEIYRFFIVAPIVCYGLFVAYWFLKLFGVNRNARDVGIRVRLIFVGLAFAFDALWGVAYLSWPFADPSTATNAAQQVALVGALICGLVFLYQNGRQSTNDRSIQAFSSAQEIYPDTAYLVNGLYRHDYIQRWMTMTTLLDEFAELLGTEAISPLQLRTAKLALYLEQSPTGDTLMPENGHGEHGLSGSDRTAFASNVNGFSSAAVYEIHDDHPLKDMLEEDLNAHRDAHYAVALLKDPRLVENLHQHPIWVQALALAIADSGAMSAQTRRAILDEEQDAIAHTVRVCYNGLLYRRTKTLDSH